MPQREPFRFAVRIRFIDTDASGRIHYTAMFRYFESAEIEFMRQLGVSYTKGDYGFPRVHVDCDFLLMLGHDDLIEIELRLTKLGRSSIGFDFRTFKGEGLAAKGRIVIACIDLKSQRAVAIPDELRTKLAARLDDSAETVGIGAES